MNNEPIWISSNVNLEESSLFLKMLNIIENKEDLPNILGVAGCSGNCSGPGGCK